MTSQRGCRKLRSMNAAELTPLFNLLQQRLSGAIVRAPEEKITSHIGLPLEWLFDLRPLFLDAEALDAVATLFWANHKHLLPLQVAGIEAAAIPLITAILMKAQQLGLTRVNGLVVRKERKITGRGKRVEGTVTQAPVVLVDDVINSGSSLEKVRVVLAEEGNPPLSGVFTVIDYQAPEGHAWLGTHKLQLSSLFTLDSFGLSMRPERPALPSRQSYKPLWHFAGAAGNPYYVVPKSAPVLAEGTIYFGDESATVHAVDAATGKPLWAFPVQGAHRKGIWSTPAVHNGKVYVGAYNGNLYCLDAKTGEQNWFYHACEWIGSSPLVVQKHNLLTLGLEYEKPNWQGGVAAFNLNTGERMWESPLKAYQHGSAAYDGVTDTVIYGTNDHTLAAYRAQTGEKIWQIATARSIKAAPVVDETRRLAAGIAFDGVIYIADIDKGRLAATVQTGNIGYTTPLVVGNRLFCGSADRHLYVINLDTLELEKKIEFSSRIFSSPRFVGPNNVIFGTCGGQVVELDATTLQVTGRVQTPDAITNALAVHPEGKAITVPSYMGELFTFSRTSTAGTAG